VNKVADKRKEIHATSLGGFVNFKSQHDFDRII